MRGRSAKGSVSTGHILVQYGDFLWRALHGDFGVSMRQNISAMELVFERIPATLELALTSFVLGITLAFALGTLMRMTRARWLREIDHVDRAGPAGGPDLLLRHPDGR